MDLDITSRRHGDRVVVSVAGEVDVHTAGQLRASLDGHVESGEVNIIVDLSSVDFLDSTGLGVLAATMTRVGVDEGTLSLVCSQERIIKVLRITGLTAVFPVYATLTDALVDTGWAHDVS